MADDDLCGCNIKKKKPDRKRLKLTGDAYKWHSFFEDQLGKECNHNITSIFEEERKHDLWYLWP